MKKIKCEKKSLENININPNDINDKNKMNNL